MSAGQGYAGCPEDGGLDRVDPGKRTQNRVVVVGVLALAVLLLTLAAISHQITIRTARGSAETRSAAVRL